MSGYDSSDPYAGMIPAYGSAEVPEPPAPIDLSADVALPEAPDPRAAEPPAADGSPSASYGSAPDASPPGGPAPEAPAADRPAAAGPVAEQQVTGEEVTEQRSPELRDGDSMGEAVLEAITGFSAQLGELVRLRARDVDLADRLYAENTRLRTGEFAAAVAPLLSGLLRLHDQMTSLAAGDAASVAGMLRIQLLQILDTAAGLTPFEPRPGERFDATRHAGAGRAATVDPAAEGTVAKVLKPGFERSDGAVVRVAQVEVYRFESR